MFALPELRLGLPESAFDFSKVLHHDLQRCLKKSFDQSPCSLFPVHPLFTPCSLPVHSLFTPCSLPVPCSHPVHTLFTPCSLPVHCTSNRTMVHLLGRGRRHGNRTHGSMWSSHRRWLSIEHWELNTYSMSLHNHLTLLLQVHRDCRYNHQHCCSKYKETAN